MQDKVRLGSMGWTGLYIYIWKEHHNTGQGMSGTHCATLQDEACPGMILQDEACPGTILQDEACPGIILQDRASPGTVLQDKIYLEA